MFLECVAGFSVHTVVSERKNARASVMKATVGERAQVCFFDLLSHRVVEKTLVKLEINQLNNMSRQVRVQEDSGFSSFFKALTCISL